MLASIRAGLGQEFQATDALISAAIAPGPNGHQAGERNEIGVLPKSADRPLIDNETVSPARRWTAVEMSR